MLHGFENETMPLSDSEKVVYPYVIILLRKATSKDNYISNPVMIENIKREYPLHKINGARVRKMIAVARLSGDVNRLCANSNGYYIEKDDFLYGKYIESLRDRASAINKIADTLESQKVTYGQKGLFSS